MPPQPYPTLNMKYSEGGAQDAPYLLEALAGDFGGEAVRVRLALLTAAARLFFKRPPTATKTCTTAGCSTIGALRGPPPHPRPCGLFAGGTQLCVWGRTCACSASCVWQSVKRGAARGCRRPSM